MRIQSYRRYLVTAAVAAVAASALTACGGGSGAKDSPAAAASVGTSLQDLYEAAKKEGKVVLWGGEDPGEMQQAFQEFSKTYPGIKLETTAVNPDQQPTKLTTAKAAGQPLPDLIQGRKEFMSSVVSARLVNTDPKWASYGVPANIISPDGGLIEYRSVYTLAYNKNTIPDPKTLPATWQALNDPSWKGKASVDPRGFPFNILAVSMGESATLDYVKSLKGTIRPDIVSGSTAGLVKLAAGAHAVRPAVLEDVKTQQAKGAPVGFVVPTPVLVQETLWYLTSDPPDRSAALLFAIWYTSAGGGQAFTAQHDNRTNQLPAEAAGKDVVTYSDAGQAATVAKVTPEIAAVWGNS
jgi:iron(III) transport system substrate-binding protein